MKKAIPCILGYCAFLFLVLEVFARFLLLATPFAEERMESNTWYRLDAVKHRSFETKGVMEHTYDPLKGWAPKPNVKKPDTSTTTSLYTNSKGLRAKTEYSYKKPDGKTRILVFGDSFTFGDGVNDEKTYPYFLQKELPETEVLNFGENGYGHDQMLLSLQSEGVRYKPDMVILGFIADDSWRNILDFRSFPKPRFELIHNQLVLKNVPVLTMASLRQSEFYRLKIVDLISLLYEKYFYKKANTKRVHQITTVILDEIVKTIQGCYATPLFVYISTPAKIKEYISKKREPEEKEFFIAYCKAKGIAYLSTEPYFLHAAENNAHLKSYGHWNAKGNLIIANAIKDYLRQTILKKE